MSDTNQVQFSDMLLCQPLLRALEEKSYTHPSPIQAAAIPHLMEGRDLIGCAQTGTGKTAAFALPLLHRFQLMPRGRMPRKPRALILAPTRELALQIGQNIEIYGKHLNISHTVIFGGVGEQPQIRALAAGAEIVVATPGRLLDLMRSRHVSLQMIEVFILDEADRMLDMGFAPDVNRIIAELPENRQSALFSATMPEPIRRLADRLLCDPVSVEVTPPASTVDRIDQRLVHVLRSDKPRLLVETLRNQREGLTLIFSRTKHGANRVAEQLERAGIRSGAIHGNKSQGARQRVLEQFRTGAIRTLVATDIAARGIDVKGISLVINYDIPVEPEAYVHRIGRTARAGAEGLAISFCDPSERDAVRSIERTIGKKIPVHGPEISAPNVPTQNGQRRGGQNRSEPSRRPDGARPGGIPPHRGGYFQKKRNRRFGRPGGRKLATANV